MFAWGEDVDVDTCFGMYSGNEQEFASAPEAEAASWHMDKRWSYAMILQRGGRWLLVDARETLDVFLRFVNSPEDVGMRANAQFSVRNGTCAADEKIPPFNLSLTDAQNACSEIWAAYG